jgi:hypothetical protein
VWIESHQELGRHPKTRKAARALDISRATMVGHLHFLWWWSLDFAQDGTLDNFDDDELAEAAEWEGDSAAFVVALTQAGFINPERALHDWHDYAGKLLEQRKANAEKQKRWRDRNKTETLPDDNGNVTVTQPLRNGATVPNLTVPNLTIPVGDTPLPPVSPDGESAQRAKSDRSARRGRTPNPTDPDCPPVAQLVADVTAWAREKGIPQTTVELQAERFLNHCEANDRRYKSYAAAFRNWVTSPINDRPGPPSGGGGGLRQKPTARENARIAMEILADGPGFAFDPPPIKYIDATYRVARVGK